MMIIRIIIMTMAIIITNIISTISIIMMMIRMTLVMMIVAAAGAGPPLQQRRGGRRLYHKKTYLPYTFHDIITSSPSPPRRRKIRRKLTWAGAHVSFRRGLRRRGGEGRAAPSARPVSAGAGGARPAVCPRGAATMYSISGSPTKGAIFFCNYVFNMY